MSHPLYRILGRLDELGHWYQLARVREGAVMIMVSTEDQRWEIEVSEDGGVAVLRFEAAGGIQTGEDVLDGLLSPDGPAGM